MTIEEAEDIYHAYRKSFKELGKGEMVQPISDLPCSPLKIRYALFVLAEYAVEHQIHTKELLEDLKMKYALISRFRENAHRINSTLQNISKSQKARDYIEERGGLGSFIASTEDIVEFHNFIVDCMGRYNPDTRG